MKTSVHNYKKIFLLVAIDLFLSLTLLAQTAPELIFRNPVLVKGTANQEGAVYRFANVTPGIDAEVKLKKFSSKNVVMRTIDKHDMGWDKAFQPEFGWEGLVPANQNWYIDFELDFFGAGSKKKQKMSKIDLTALDIDGDGRAISEYVVFDKPKSVSYSTVTYLQNSVVGSVGQLFTCGECGNPGKLYTCSNCKGTGLNGINECGNCNGSGKLHEGCSHAYSGPTGTAVNGTVENFSNIDTLGTQVMATYNFENVDGIKFRYGAKTGNAASNGAGVRLNSTWFRQFSLKPMTTLPVQVSAFSANWSGNAVLLQWSGNEENFSYYTIQRSVDGTNYSDVGLVMAANEKGLNAYQFSDKTLPAGSPKLYYRLKLTDRTKEITYTGSRKVSMGNMHQDLSLQTYPNPTQAYANLVLPQLWMNEPVQVQVYNFNGVLVRSLPIQKGSAVHGLDLTGLVKGEYIVKAGTAAATLQQKIIKN